jgi:hypothetical protein
VSTPEARAHAVSTQLRATNLLNMVNEAVGKGLSRRRAGMPKRQRRKGGSVGRGRSEPSEGRRLPAVLPLPGFSLVFDEPGVAHRGHFDASRAPTPQQTHDERADHAQGVEDPHPARDVGLSSTLHGTCE